MEDVADRLGCQPSTGFVLLHRATQRWAAMSVDARIRQGPTMIDNSLPSVDTAQGVRRASARGSSRGRAPA